MANNPSYYSRFAMVTLVDFGIALFKALREDQIKLANTSQLMPLPYPTMFSR